MGVSFSEIKLNQIYLSSFFFRILRLVLLALLFVTTAEINNNA